MTSTYDPLLPTPYVEGEELSIYRFGDLFVNSVCPDFETNVVLQTGNDRPTTKMVPKRSWELKDNRIGASTPGEPRSAEADFQPYLPINLIDGNDRTYWASRGQGRPGTQPEWIRIDLARESTVREIVLVPRSDGQGLPPKLSILVSRDAHAWTPIYDTEALPRPDAAGAPLRFPLTCARRVKQVWIRADDLPQVDIHLYGWSWQFWLAQVEVLDTEGNNVALASRGAGVTVSSVNYGIRLTHDELDKLWPIHFDVGFKWVRLAYCEAGNSPLHWYYVEREKGKYQMDPRVDEAITQTVDAGVNIVLTLAYANWLYAEEPKVRPQRTLPELWPMTADMPPAPVEPKMREGFKNYVRFMVRHFKDRIRYYEVWNEPDVWCGWVPGGANVQEFCSLVKEVAPIVKEEHPEARVVLGSSAWIPAQYEERGTRRWLYDCLDEGVGPYVDAIGFHPYYNLSPEACTYRSYARLIREFQAYAESHGFQGEYMATEYHWIADYPPSDRQKGMDYFPTEIQKAKNLARAVVENVALRVIPFWCETWNSQQCAIGLLRNGFASYPDSPVTTEPVYYVMRTLCTVLEGVEPIELSVTFSDNLHLHQSYAFRKGSDEVLVALWLPGASRDDHSGYPTDVLVNGVRAREIQVIDMLNGLQQELIWKQEESSVVLPKLVVRDYPLVLCLKLE